MYVCIYVCNIIAHLDIVVYPLRKVFYYILTDFSKKSTRRFRMKHILLSLKYHKSEVKRAIIYNNSILCEVYQEKAKSTTTILS